MVEKELGEVISRMSPSRIDVAQRCLALFKYRYVVPDDLKHPSGWKRAFGAAMDTAANGVYTSKFESHVTPDAEDAAAQFAAAWDAESETVEDWSGTSKSDKLDSGVQGVKQWRENIALYCQPKQLPQLHVQKDVIDEKDNTTWTLHGYVDLVCDMPGHQDVVTDLKTSGRKYSGSAIQVNTQPAAYTYITGTSTFSYHVVTSTKVPKVQVLTAGVDASTKSLFIKRAEMIRRQIRNAYMTGDWLPNRQHMLCSKTYCEQWHRCQGEFGGEVKP